jgi:hypothetical protein
LTATLTLSGGATGNVRFMIIWRTGRTATEVTAWGAQLETSSTATAYIPTTTAAVTVVLPRITNRGILVEEARTNSLYPSNDFNDARWSDFSTGTTTRTGGFSSPDGTNNAWRLQGNNANTWWGNAGNPSPPSGGTWASKTATFSMWVRADAAYTAILYFNFNGGLSYGLNISVTDTWQRFTFTQTFVAGDTQALRGAINHKSGNNTYVYGAQVEEGSFATSPIITTGAAGTRGADSATVGSFVLPAAYTWVPEGYAPPIQTGLFPAMMGSTGSNTGLLLTGSTNTPGANMGNGTFNGGYGSAVAAGASIKQGFRAETNNAMGASKGTLGTVDTSFTPVVGSQTINIGTNHLGASPWNSYITRIRVLPMAATDAQLQALTAP